MKKGKKQPYPQRDTSCTATVAARRFCVTQKRCAELAGRMKKAYVCSGYPACDSFVLAHPSSLEPMGSLARPELRRLRFEAHRQFDQLHRAGIMTKRQSYVWLAQIVHAPMSHAHIGHLGEYFCKEVIRESKELLKKNKVPGGGYGGRDGGQGHSGNPPAGPGLYQPGNW